MSAECVAEDIQVGYKQTEVGVIPEDWLTPALGSLAVLMTNGFVGTATTHYASNDNGTLYIQGYNVEENSFNFHGIKFVTEDFHSAHMKSCLRGGDLLTVQTGDVGITTIVPESLAGSNCHALIISRFDQKKVFSAFISYYLNSKPGRSRLKLIETGTTMKHLNVGDMLHFSIPLPPTLAEQEAIAQALTDVDAFIESLEQLIAKKLQIKQGAMQELLMGKRRMHGFEIKKGYKQTDIGLIPQDWELTYIGNIATVEGGFAFNSKKFLSRGKYQVIKMSNLYEGRLNLGRSISYINELNEQEKKYLLEQNDILITLTGTVGKQDYGYSYKINEEKNLLVNQRVGRIVVNTEVVPNYVAFQMQTPWFLNQFFDLAKGGTGNQANVGTKDIEKIMIPLPSLQEQSFIATILTDIDREISVQGEKLAKSLKIKQGVMQELLTGRIRLV
jgi:type I restriction enzyme S subunit